MPPPGSPPDATELERRRRVVELLGRAADPTGFVPFDRFMEIALYAEEVGYYARVASPLGPSGDFYTAVHVDPLFAESLARRVEQVRSSVADPSRFTVVELGPGDGTLAAALVRSFALHGSVSEYVLVDRSSARAREASARVAADDSAVAVRTSASLADLGPVTGVVIANELLDAAPARRLRWTDGAWHELGVRLEGASVAPAVGGVAGPVPGPPLPSNPRSGQVVELSPEGEGLVREVADHLADGISVWVDFGDDEPALLDGHPDGTLAAVRGHRFSADPYADPGAQDLSTFVNFSRLRAVARTAGLVELSYRSQAEALGAWGFVALRDEALRAAPNAETRVRRQLAAKNLLFGFERFRVLELAPPRTAARLGAAT